MVLPTHHYEKIIERLGGNPAELPDRCECTMVDKIVELIDNGIEGGGGGGGGAFVVRLTYDETGRNEQIDKTYAEIREAAKTQPVFLIAEWSNADIQQYNLVYSLSDYVLFASPYVDIETRTDGSGLVGGVGCGVAYVAISPDNIRFISDWGLSE